MANEMRLIPDGKKVTLDELIPGTIFAFGDDCIAVKSEYRCANGLIEAFIIDSGEQFWGGAKTAKEQNALMVQPLAIEEVETVEVVRCKDCKHWIHLEDGMGDCTNGRFHIPGVADITMTAEEFCCSGERKGNDL